MNYKIRINKREISERDDAILAIAAYIPVFALMLQCFGYAVMGELAAIHMAALVISAIPAVVSMFVWIKRKFSQFVAVYLLWLIVFSVHYIVFPENQEGYWSRTTDLFALCLPCFLNISLIRNLEIHKRVMKYIGGAVFVVGELMLVYRLTSGSIQMSEYSMSYSNYMLFSALIFMYSFIKEHKPVQIILSGLCFVSMVILGSRGAVVAWLIYLVIVALVSHYNKLFKTLVFFVSAMFVVNYERIIQLIYTLANNAGITSRTLELLARGELISHDSGRSILRDKAIEAILNHPFVGNGIGSEYRLLGTYSHNIVLDIMMHYGIIFGGVVILIIIAIFAIKFMREKDKMFYMLFFCYGAIPLLVSGSYLNAMPFWILLGYCFSRTYDTAMY